MKYDELCWSKRCEYSGELIQLSDSLYKLGNEVYIMSIHDSSIYKISGEYFTDILWAIDDATALAVSVCNGSSLMSNNKINTPPTWAMLNDKYIYSDVKNINGSFESASYDINGIFKFKTISGNKRQFYYSGNRISKNQLPSAIEVKFKKSPPIVIDLPDSMEYRGDRGNG